MDGTGDVSSQSEIIVTALPGGSERQVFTPSSSNNGGATLVVEKGSGPIIRQFSLLQSTLSQW